MSSVCSLFARPPIGYCGVDTSAGLKLDPSSLELLPVECRQNPERKAQGVFSEPGPTSACFDCNSNSSWLSSVYPSSLTTQESNRSFILHSIMSTGTMKAVVFHGPGKVSVEDRPIPKLQEDGDIIVKVDKVRY